MIQRHVEAGNADAQKDLAPHYYSENGSRYAEFNVNASSAFEPFVHTSAFQVAPRSRNRNAHPLGGDLSVREFPTGRPVPGGPDPIIKLGQDEETFAAFAHLKSAGRSMALRRAEINSRTPY